MTSYFNPDHDPAHDRLEVLLTATSEWELTKEYLELCSKYVVVHDILRVAELPTRESPVIRIFKDTDFTRVIGANRKVTVPNGGTKEQPRTKQVNAAQFFRMEAERIEDRAQECCRDGSLQCGRGRHMAQVIAEPGSKDRVGRYAVSKRPRPRRLSFSTCGPRPARRIAISPAPSSTPAQYPCSRPASDSAPESHNAENRCPRWRKVAYCLNALPDIASRLSISENCSASPA